jgi:hypothetical protein
MSVPSVYVLHGIQTPNNFYSVVNDATPRSLLEALTQFASGFPEPLFTAVRAVRPEIVFTTHQVGTAISEFGLTGAALNGGNTDLYYKKVTDHGARYADASAVHIRLRAANAFGYCRSFRAKHRQDGTVEIRIACPYDGTNLPIVAAGSVALAGTAAASEFYTLGPVTVNGAACGGDELVVDLNPEMIEIGDEGEIYDTFCAVKTIRPTVMVKGVNMAPWTSYGVTGAALTAFAGYFRRKTSDGNNVANGTASHVKFSCAQGLIAVEQSSGGGNNEAELNLKLYLRAASSAAHALTLASGSAIT